MARAQLNAIDRLHAFFSPVAGVQRLQARHVLAQYEAAKPSIQRKFSRDNSGPDRLVQQGAVALRNQVRDLERNHDLVKGSIDTLVNNTVGAAGIGVEFQPRRMDGSIHTEYRDALADAFRDWKKRPEVTWTHTWAKTQRLMARTWYRDGEAFSQDLMGPVQFLNHGTRVPYSIELLEPDMVPMNYNDVTDLAKNVRQGIMRDAWGRKQSYLVYRIHPTDLLGIPNWGDLKTIPADRMLHLAQLDRIGQLRGVTRYASVITRLSDIKDYEESERIAAKVAAMLTAYVKRLAPEGGGYEAELDEAGQPKPREISMSPGTIIDTLAVGEEIGLIDSKRPNPNLVTFRQGQIRMFAAGVGASYSSLSRDYSGTYSSQRQELVETFVNYACLTDDFVGMWVAPVVERFRQVADLSGVVPLPRDVKPGTEDDVLFIAPSMPWIDPLKEAMAYVALCQAGFASEVEVIRRRGGTPETVIAQISEFRRAAADKGLIFNSDAAFNMLAQSLINDAQQPNNDPGAPA